MLSVRTRQSQVAGYDGKVTDAPQTDQPPHGCTGPHRQTRWHPILISQRLCSITIKITHGANPAPRTPGRHSSNCWSALRREQETADPRFLLRHRHEHRAHCCESKPGCIGSRHRSVCASAGKTSSHSDAQKLSATPRRSRAVLALPCGGRHHTAQPLAPVPQPLAQSLADSNDACTGMVFFPVLSRLGGGLELRTNWDIYRTGVRSGSRPHRHQGSNSILRPRRANHTVRTKVCGSGPDPVAFSR